jgi:sugar transferase EpsL
MSHARLSRSKRLFDVVVGTVSIVVTSPLLLIVAAAVRVTLGAPVFFRQRRPGLNGVPFEIVKFRTLTDQRDASGALLDDARRMTSLGRWLRRTSLDELPELFNVVRGEMSLVGPRPLLMQYLERYTPRQARRHEVRPGITGLAQVSGRNLVTWEERFEIDVWYVENWTFGLDLKVLVRTLVKVVTREGINQPGHETAREFLGSDGSRAADARR